MIESISQKGDNYLVTIHKDQSGNLDGQKLMAVSNQFEGKVRLIPGAQILIEFRCKSMKPEASIELLEQFLAQYKSALKIKGELHNVAK
jgi:transcription-repair coupling factor (superfamily II helicase)